jgi:Cd2+/Zn2+-exporting ATPase
MQKKHCEECCCCGEDESQEEAGSGKKIAVFVTAVVLWLGGLGVERLSSHEWLSLIPFGAAYLLAGLPVLRNAWRNLSKGRLFDENFLMSIATIGAFAIGEWEEAVGVMIFYMIGELIQNVAVSRSKASIDSLLALKPDKARVLREGQWSEVPAELALAGDLVRVWSGERIPVDGVVVEGNASVDASMLSGEAAPIQTTAGTAVYSGTVSLDGVLTIRATKIASESSAAKIVDLVRNARASKAKPERFITTFARYYTPAIIGAAVLIGVLPPLFFGGEWAVWVRRALVLLVISCPCALVVSVPLGYFAGIGGLSRRGVMVKGAVHLDSLSKARFVAFDKTGTLTKGEFSVTKIEPAEGFDELRLLKIAARAESESNHPIAKAIKQAADKRGVLEKDVEKVGVREIAGLGIETEDGILAGNRKLLAERGISVSAERTLYTAVYAAKDGVYCGRILIGDTVKDKAVSAVAALRRLGVAKTLMLTGDTREGAFSIAKELGVDEVEAELLPEDKVSIIEKWAERDVTVFVGDGVNDAPVLARADVGIVMGSGADAAVEAADVVIMTNEPDRVPEAIRLSRKIRMLVIENVVFALAAKAVFITLAVFGVANMWLALFADVGVCLIAILNSSRALLGAGKVVVSD